MKLNETDGQIFIKLVKLIEHVYLIAEERQEGVIHL